MSQRQQQQQQQHRSHRDRSYCPGMTVVIVGAEGGGGINDISNHDENTKRTTFISMEEEGDFSVATTIVPTSGHCRPCHDVVVDDDDEEHREDDHRCWRFQRCQISNNVNRRRHSCRRRRYNSFFRSSTSTGPSSFFFVAVAAVMIISVSLVQLEAFTPYYTSSSYRPQSGSPLTIGRRSGRRKRQEHGNVATMTQSLSSSLRSPSFLSASTSTLSTSSDTTSSSPSSDVVVELEWTELFSPKAPTATSTTPVVFLHGLLGSKRNFASLATMLGVQLQTPRTVYGVDLRNHGDNKETNHVLEDGCMLYPHMANDVIEFLDSQKIDKCILVGHSMGGKVGQALALLYPERVEGLVVIDIAPVTYTRTNNPNWKAVEDILIALKETTTSSERNDDGDGDGDGLTKQQVDKALRPAVPDPALRAFVLTNYDSHRCKWKIPITTLVRELENIAGFDLKTTGTEQQHQYDGDVFIIHGGQSKFVRHAYMDTIAQFFPNHLLTTIRGAGHWVHAEAPDDTVALLKRFLDR
mmetsp:Transcript_16419/g.40057  ORF Transcript_16419/g.40057 Transcript_16419/m.40057 type:complete len:524 (+) Transcript_16419:51-1622(+)